MNIVAQKYSKTEILQDAGLIVREASGGRVARGGHTLRVQRFTFERQRRLRDTLAQDYLTK